MAIPSLKTSPQTQKPPTFSGGKKSSGLEYRLEKLNQAETQCAGLSEVAKLAGYVIRKGLSLLVGGIYGGLKDSVKACFRGSKVL